MEHDMLRRFGCALCALAFALTALPTAAFAQQPEEQAAVQQSLSATDVREMQQADAAVTALTGGSDYAQMTEDERTDAALQQLDALTAQGLVKQGSVYTDAENGMISFTYSCGALGGILLTDPEEENTAALPELDESQLQELAENKRVGTAAIYYAFDNTINSTRYPYYAYMQTYWDSVGLQTDLDTTVTVSDLRRMGRYDLCILSTHGAYYTYEYGWLFKKTATEPLILLTERSDFWSDLRYGFDLLAHRVVKVNGMYAVNGDFFRSAYRGNGIVLSETCEFYGKNGHVDTSMADELQFTVWHTPGHTPGGVVLLCGEYLFCGDTLFAGSIGRTDLEGGSSAQMAESLRKLAKLPIPRGTQVLPGHGEFSTFGDELDNNYFIRSAVRGNNDLF